MCLGGPQASMRFALGHLWATREQLRPLTISIVPAVPRLQREPAIGRSLVTPTEADDPLDCWPHNYSCTLGALMLS